MNKLQERIDNARRVKDRCEAEAERRLEKAKDEFDKLSLRPL